MQQEQIIKGKSTIKISIFYHLNTYLAFKIIKGPLNSVSKFIGTVLTFMTGHDKLILSVGNATDIKR